MYRKRQAAILLAVLSLCATVTAVAKDPYDGDTPLYRCAGHDEFDKFGNHWLRSGEDSAAVDGDIDRGMFAAMHWITGWPGEGDELTGVEDHAEVVPPRGVRLPIAGIRQAASEVRACWVLRALGKDEERPIKLKDARKPLQVTCSMPPPNLRKELPSLSDVGRVHIDAKKGTMNFFGAALRLVPHVGSAYVGIGQEFAVTLHKSTGKFRITLPQGRGLAGSRGFLPSGK